MEPRSTMLSKSPATPEHTLDKGHPYATDAGTFRKMITQLWFEHYSRARNATSDTSGFEHVFVGESRPQVAKGGRYATNI
ncbi:hypothetical protein TELCIR_03674 [Teladorsagia circumcincta]|uniref:EndoU domain-containing protein n=1 Tax=Teladorsagia circumcincta TaxID=45464 RepID=A0A2G9UVZ3_TELCI|nr:hypothetical protein TELCIR_03674 [Teladorsagia circumcincta]